MNKWSVYFCIFLKYFVSSDLESLECVHLECCQVLTIFNILYTNMSSIQTLQYFKVDK